MHFRYDETVEASAQRAWQVMRDFAAIERAGLAQRVAMVGEGPGSCRHLYMPGGSVLVECLEVTQCSP